MGKLWRSLIFRIHLNGPTFQSYGGFMSSKVVEANAGVHSLAIAVAVGSSLVFLSRLFANDCRSVSLSRVGDYTVSFAQIEGRSFPEI